MSVDLQKIKIINEKMKGNNFNNPSVLYKYRPFDKFTFDMLDKDYVYMCPAKNLDDEKECTVSFEVEDLLDVHSEQLTAMCVFNIMQMVKPYTSEENFEKSKEIVQGLMTEKGLVRRDWLLFESFDLQELYPNYNIAHLVNCLASIPYEINKPESRKRIETLLINAQNVREQIGICSLTELKNDHDMWVDYADDEKGYCIEYCLNNYEPSQLLFPVVYEDDRQNNVMLALVSDFIGGLVSGMSNGEMETDITRYLRIFLTKDLKWEPQKEWRLIGEAGFQLPAPKINAIYLGKNVSEKDKQEMTMFCATHKIKLIQY